METSPPVRDVSERNREKRNKCIIVAVTSLIILVGIVLGAAYITHFRFSELTTSSANPLVDAALSKISNNSLIFCNTYELILKDDNDTLLIQREGDCAEQVLPTLDEDDKKRNETEGDGRKGNILCKISASNVKLASTPAAAQKISKDCKFPVIIDVLFDFLGTSINNITFTPEASIAKSKIATGIAEQVAKVVAPEILSAVTASFTTSDPVIIIENQDPQQYCTSAPWGC